MSFKRLFSRSLQANPGRLHMAAHSHHLWPDASFDGQMQCWNDAARLADRKWDRVMGEIWPEAQGHVADELGTGAPDAVVFAPNTHDLLIRLLAAAPRPSDGPLRLLTSDGEFHSARRQFARLEEAGLLSVERVSCAPFDSFDERLLKAASEERHDVIFVSHVFFGSGRIFDAVDELSALARPHGPWVVIDGYHAFMAIDRPFDASSAKAAFYMGGGYKYAMSGEGCAFLHAPPGFGPRPLITGWFAEFDDLSLPPGMIGYAPDGMRFMGATFDSSGLYRFNCVRRMLAENDLSTARIAAHVDHLQRRLLDGIDGTALGGSELLNPVGDGAHARFLAFRSEKAPRWYETLLAEACVTDVRGDVLRIGLGLYHDESDIDAFVSLAKKLS